MYLSHSLLSLSIYIYIYVFFQIGSSNRSWGSPSKGEHPEQLWRLRFDARCFHIIRFMALKGRVELHGNLRGPPQCHVYPQEIRLLNRFPSIGALLGPYFLGGWPWGGPLRFPWELLIQNGRLVRYVRYFKAIFKWSIELVILSDSSPSTWRWGYRRRNQNRNPKTRNVKLKAG